VNVRVLPEGSAVAVIIAAMFTLVGPISTVPRVSGRCGIIGIPIPGIRIVVDVWVPMVPIRIVIKVPRRTVVAARESKTESLCSGNQDGRLSLSVRALGWEQGQTAYRKCGQKKSSHRFFLSFVSLSFVFARAGTPAQHFLDALRFSAAPMRESDIRGRAVAKQRKSPKRFSSAV
jgi:hypothetical protein